MGGVAAYARYLIMEQTRDGVDSSPIGHVIEHLDAPPANARVWVRQTFSDRVECPFGEFGHSEMSGSNTTRETAQRFDLSTSFTELLNEPLLRSHANER